MFLFFIDENFNIMLIFGINKKNCIKFQRKSFNKILQSFEQKAKKYIMKISLKKMKSLTIFTEQTQCKLVLNILLIEQVINFQYLWVDIRLNQERLKEAKKQVNKAGI